MPRKIDPKIDEVLKRFGIGAEACWDCHGVWVVYHKFLEQIAVKASIKFDAPIVLEANGLAKSVALCVTGHLNGVTDWSIGEASPANNKNGYPYAMAEKRARDRIIIKLIGLHGFAYSEEEADDFKASEAEPKSNVTPMPQKEFRPAVTSNAVALGREIVQCKTLLDLNRLKAQSEFVAFWKAAHSEDRDYITGIANKRKAELEEVNILQAGE